MKSLNPDRRTANIAPFGLRMHPDLKQQIEEQARANGRSLNAEIVWRLEQSLSSAKPSAEWVQAAKN
jgi:predicted HicB family RNase H-like nuclease